MLLTFLLYHIENVKKKTFRLRDNHWIPACEKFQYRMHSEVNGRNRIARSALSDLRKVAHSGPQFL